MANTDHPSQAQRMSGHQDADTIESQLVAIRSTLEALRLMSERMVKIIDQIAVSLGIRIS